MQEKGFVTIATGDDRFMRLAYDLKKSYDYQHQDIKYPWAILTDKRDDYLSIFEKVVILPHATCSYLDKITMLSIAPWDENIFVDADCLIYGDISNLFDYSPFRGVRHMGDRLPISSKGKGWFDIENIGKFRKSVNFKIHSNGELIFFDKSETTYEIYKTCLDIVNHWPELRFREFSLPADEPIMALSMAVHNCPPIQDNLEKYVYFYRVHKKICKIDIKNGELSYVNKWNDKRYDNVPIAHWGNQETNGYLYKSEVLKMEGVTYWYGYKVFWSCHDNILRVIYKIKANLYRLSNLRSK